MRDDRQRLLHMVEAIKKIEKYAARGRAAFEADELVQTWVLHHLRILGEAVRGLSDGFRSRHVELPFGGIVGMRNVLVHHYFEIDLDLVWSVVETDLPDLKTKVSRILASDPGDPP